MVLARRDWPTECVSFEYLDSIPAEEYLINKRVMTDDQRIKMILSERKLIANRLQIKGIAINNNMFICPKHRNTFGVGWVDRSNVCHHPAHEGNEHPSPKDCRRANLLLCSQIDGFPIGGR